MPRPLHRVRALVIAGIVACAVGSAAAAGPNDSRIDVELATAVRLVEEMESQAGMNGGQPLHPSVRASQLRTVADHHLLLGRRSRAVKILEQLDVEPLDETNVRIFIPKLAERAAIWAAVDPDRARGLLTKLESLQEKHPQEYLNAAYTATAAYLELGEFRRAIDAVLPVAKERPPNGMLLCANIASYLRSAGRPEFMDELRRLVRDTRYAEGKADPNSTNVKMLEVYRIYALAAADLPDEAIDRSDARFADEWEDFRLAERAVSVTAAYLRTGDPVKAREFVRRFHDRTSAGLRSQLALAAAVAGDFELAEKLVAERTSSTIDPLLPILVYFANRAGRIELRDAWRKTAQEFAARNPRGPTDPSGVWELRIAYMEAAIGRPEPALALAAQRDGINGFMIRDSIARLIEWEQKLRLGRQGSVALNRAFGIDTSLVDLFGRP